MLTHADKECICNGHWLSCAKDILIKNNIDYDIFAVAFWTALKHGWQKHGNIILYGQADCSKTFLLMFFCKLLPFHDPGKLKLWLVGCRKSQPYISSWSTVGPKGINGGNIEWGVSSTYWKVRLYCYLPQWVIFITH